MEKKEGKESRSEFQGWMTRNPIVGLGQFVGNLRKTQVWGKCCFGEWWRWSKPDQSSQNTHEIFKGRIENTWKTGSICIKATLRLPQMYFCNWPGRLSGTVYLQRKVLRPGVRRDCIPDYAVETCSRSKPETGSPSGFSNHP